MSDAVETIARIEALPPGERGDAFDRAQRDAYWERKDIAAVRAISRAGIRSLLALANEADGVSEGDALRGRAKALAYNLGSFAWPGWDEAGVSLSADDVADGRSAARLNLQLAIALGRPDRVLADAWRLIGAHSLAARDFAAAAESFAEARAFAEAAGEATRVAMLDGYDALAASLADPAASAGKLEARLAALRAAGGARYAGQLETAARVFARP